jgi:hypothetical protein
MNKSIAAGRNMESCLLSHHGVAAIRACLAHHRHSNYLMREYGRRNEKAFEDQDQF